MGENPGQKVTVRMSASLLRKMVDSMAARGFRSMPSEEQGWGYCYIDTVLGELRVDIHGLLALTGQFLQWKNVEDTGEVKITQKEVDAALKILERLPAYLFEDFHGIMFEHAFDRHLSECDKPTNWAGFFKTILDPDDGKVNLWLFRRLLAAYGAKLLAIDDMRLLFAALFAEGELYGKDSWRKLIERQIRPVRRPGRPRKIEYDRLFEKRSTGSQMQLTAN